MKNNVIHKVINPMWNTFVSSLLQVRMANRMKRYMLVAAIVFSFLITTQGAWSGTLYVDACALISGNGSVSRPYNSLRQAVSATDNYDEIKMKGGSYPETLSINKPVSITAYEGSALAGAYHVGWKDVVLDLSSLGLSSASTNARVYYPAYKSGRNAQILHHSCAGPFPAVVYAHALRYKSETLCEWCNKELQDDTTEDYLQAEGILKRLAASGTITMSFNWHSVTSNYKVIAEITGEAINFLDTEFVN